MLIHLRQTDNERLKGSGRIRIPQCLELLGGHAGYFGEVFKGFTACSRSDLHLDQSLGEGRAAHFSFDADRGQRRCKAQNLRFGQADLCAGSGQSHGHQHDGGFSGGEVVAQLNQRGTEVSEQALIHAGDVCKLRQCGSRLGSNDVGGIAQVDHSPCELGQIIRTDAQLTGYSDNLSDIIGRGGDFRGHALDLIREGSELFLGGIDRLADRGESRLIRNGRLDRRRSQRQYRRGHYGGQCASNGAGYLADLVAILAEGIKALSGFCPCGLCSFQVLIGLFDFLPGFGKGGLGTVECGFRINHGIGCLLDLFRIVCILCCLHLIFCSLQGVLIFGDGVLLQSQLFTEHAFGLFASVFAQHFLCTAGGHLLNRFGHSFFCFLQLKIRQRMHHRPGARLRFLPACTVEADVVRCRRVAQFLNEMLAQQTCLSDICAVIGIVGEASAALGIPLFGRNIVVLGRDTLIETLGAAPDGHKFRIFQRRFALGCPFHESVVGFIGIAVSLENPACEMRHGAVSAAFGDRAGAVDVHIPECIIVCFRIVHLKAFIECETAGMELDIGFFCAKEESCRIQRLGIEVREDAVHALFQGAVFCGIRHLIDQEQHMELGTRSFAALFLHAVAAEMNGKGDIRERPAYILRGDPFIRAFRVIVVAVHAQTGRGQEVGVRAVAFLIGNAHIIPAHNLAEDNCI